MTGSTAVQTRTFTGTVVAAVRAVAGRLGGFAIGAVAALLGTFEPLLGPIWVWLVHSEVPSGRTLAGGAIVFAALLVHIALEAARQSRPERPGVTGIPSPN